MTKRRFGGFGENYSYPIASPGDQCVVCEWVTTHLGLRCFSCQLVSCQSVQWGMALASTASAESSRIRRI